MFIQYLTAAANAVCKGAGRQTLSEDDVYAALADIQFAEFVPPLQEAAKGALHIKVDTCSDDSRAACYAWARIDVRGQGAADPAFCPEKHTACVAKPW